MLISRSLKSSQRGVTLFLAMIVLVAMMLSGIALFRTVDSGVLVAGNLAMQKSATRQGDQGSEAATTWLMEKSQTDPTALHEDSGAVGYVDYPFYVANALNDLPTAGQGWPVWWTAYTATHAPAVLATDPATGNTVAYLIQRLCSANGAPHAGAVACATPPESTDEGGSRGAGGIAMNRPTAVYYRITSRIEGPRNTVSFTQTVVSL